MSSSGIRGIRRKKSSLGEVKVAVVGAPGVGKSGEFSYFAKIYVPFCIKRSLYFMLSPNRSISNEEIHWRI